VGFWKCLKDDSGVLCYECLKKNLLTLLDFFSMLPTKVVMLI